jgi:glycosyltransferase involved in cell wall biosynthesis
MIQTSIIIPVRNQKNPLLVALNSLKRQIKTARAFEIIICDDGSTDGTEQMVKKLRIPIFFKYFKNDPPLGRSANRNAGFKKSVGREIVFFDGDMVPADGYLDAILGNTDNLSVRVGIAKPPPDTKADRLEKYLYSRGRYAYTGESQTIPSRYFTSNNFCIGRENFEKIGGFDEAFKGWGGEDIDFGLSLEANGISVKNVPKAVTFHYHKRSLESLIEDFRDFGANSFDHLITRHPDFIKQIPGHMLGLPGYYSPAQRILKAFSFITINGQVLRLAAKTVTRFKNFNWPDYIFDYILWGNLACAYKKRVMNE